MVAFVSLLDALPVLALLGAGLTALESAPVSIWSYLPLCEHKPNIRSTGST